MRAIAQSIENDKPGVTAELKGRQIDLVKVQRWQKRQGRMKSAVRSLANQHVDCKFCSCMILDQPNAWVSVPTDDELNNTDGPELPLPDAGNSTLIPVESTSISPTKILEFSQSLSIWAAVDVPGSPTLSRLFEALQIECPMEITPISIGSPVEESAKSYIADIDIVEISDGKQTDDAIEEGHHGANFLSYCSSMGLHKESTVLSYPGWSLPNESFDEWAFSQWDFSKGQPFNIELNVGPTKPLSPFPIPPAANVRRIPGFKLPIAFDRRKEIEMEEILYKTRLRKLKRTLNADDPRILNVRRSLADVYSKQCKYRQKERLLRHIAIGAQRTYGFGHHMTLSAYIDVVDLLIDQGKQQHAAKIHHLVHTTIVSLFGLEDYLTLRSMVTMSNVCYFLNRDGEAERLYRQVLQMRLNTLGPRHGDSLAAMEHLATFLRSRSHTLLESERLLSTVIQLQQEVESISEHEVCHSEVELARVLGFQGRYRESQKLSLRAAERVEIALGPEHQQTLRAKYQVARCLYRLEQHAECQILLRKTLEQQLEQLGLSHRHTVDTMDFLASTFKKTCQHQEAIPLYEKCLRVYAEDYGPEHSYTLQTCNNLGRCYEELGRYEDAFSLYQRTIDQLRSTNHDDHPAIMNISHTMANIRDIVAVRRECASDRQVEIDVEDALGIEGDSVGKRWAGWESNLAKEGSSMNDEDWMNDFVDFQTPKEDAGKSRWVG